MLGVDWQHAFDLLFSAFMVIVGVVTKSLWDAIKELTRDVRSLEKMLPETYARKDDFAEKFDLIMTMLKEIRDELKKKVDK